MIEFKEVYKNYGEIEALKCVSFYISKGEVVALLGPNGAGKTTTVNLMLGFLKPDKGYISFLDKEPYKENIFKKVGVVLENVNCYNSLTLEENLLFFGEIYEVKNLKGKIEFLLRKFDLHNKRKEKFGKLSKGMKQKFALAKALLHDPEILILDEPTSGLDIEWQNRIIEVLNEFVEERKITLFFTSHNLFIVENLAKRVIFINNGKIKADYKIGEIFGKFNGKKLIVKKEILPKLKFENIKIKQKGEFAEIILYNKESYEYFIKNFDKNLIIKETPCSLNDAYEHILYS
ncbi:MAG: ABC transporter ATP-binding protein [candidate division WOR-3 bacterium]